MANFYYTTPHCLEFLKIIGKSDESNKIPASELDVTIQSNLIISADQIDNIENVMPKEKFTSFLAKPDNLLIVVDYYRYSNIQSFINFLRQYCVACRVNIILQHYHLIEELKANLNSQGLINIKVSSFDFWIYKTSKVTKTPKRFSIFSRRYQDERFDLFVDLYFNNILSNSYYTFTNFHPDNMQEISKESLIEMIPVKYRSSHLYSDFKDWINNIPYTFHDNIYDPFADSTYDFLEKSDFHIVLETMQVFTYTSPVVITEKTYKAMYCKKPFIILGVPNSLEILRKNGFKTFSPIINESYDSIDDFTLRKQNIVQEIIKLNNLNNSQWKDLLKEVDSIVNYNYEHMKKLNNKLLADWSAEFCD